MGLVDSIVSILVPVLRQFRQLLVIGYQGASLPVLWQGIQAVF